MVGFSEVLGSWNTMLIRRPRMPRISRAEVARRSSPERRMLPDSSVALAGR
jgi:hypothetical protein